MGLLYELCEPPTINPAFMKLCGPHFPFLYVLGGGRRMLASCTISSCFMGYFSRGLRGYQITETTRHPCLSVEHSTLCLGSWSCRDQLLEAWFWDSCPQSRMGLLFLLAVRGWKEHRCQAAWTHWFYRKEKKQQMLFEQRVVLQKATFDLPHGPNCIIWDAQGTENPSHWFSLARMLKGIVFIWSACSCARQAGMLFKATTPYNLLNG